MPGPADPLQKTWGWSTRVYCNEHLQVERIYVRAGGYSSIHLHQHKANQFCVVRGDLAVNLFDDGNTLTHCEAVPVGSSFLILPPARHQFVARSLVEGYEVYWTTDSTEIDPHDIVRFSNNGVDEEWTRRVVRSGYVCCCQCNEQYLVADMTTVCVDNALRDMCKQCVSRTSAQPFRVGAQP